MPRRPLLVSAPDAASLIARWRFRLVLSASAALGGCSAQHATHVVETAPYVAPDAPVSLSGTQLVAGADYFAFYEPVDHVASFGGEGGPTVVIESDGNDCATFLRNRGLEGPDAMSEEHACARDYAERLESPSGRSLLVVRDGQESRYIAATDLAPIDTREKAAIAVWMSGHSLSYSRSAEDIGGGLHAADVSAHDGVFDVTVGLTHQERIEPDRVRVEYYRMTVRVRGDGGMEEVDRTLVTHYEQAYEQPMPLGRRPEHFDGGDFAQSLRGLLERALHHEAESVRAFERMARELEYFEAPATLVAASRKAAEDERRHAHQTTQLAAALGYELEAGIATDTLPVRTLLEVARENAIEGCLLETYAASMALHQARHAPLAVVREHFAGIAEDEFDHAALAHVCQAFFVSRLDSGSVAEIHSEVIRQRAKLASSFRVPTTAERLLGFPEPHASRGLLSALAAA